MPLDAFGDLRFVPILDLGKLGPREGRPVLQSWSWYEHAWILMPWLLVAIPLLLRPNRNRAAALILLPLLVLCVPGLVIVLVDPGLEAPVCSMIIGLGATCLLLPWITRPGRGSTYGLVLLVLLATMSVATASYLGGRLVTASNGGSPLLFPLFCSAWVVASLFLASDACRREFKAGRFLLLLAMGLASCAIILLLVVLMLTGGGDDVAEEWPVVLMSGVMIGVLGFLVLLPFLILALASSIHRERFRAALHLPRDSAPMKPWKGSIDLL